MNKVTMQDVATKAGVSKSTVSQFINNRYQYMAKDTKLRIDRAVKELGYVPNHIAKSLKQKRTSTIGVIVANIIHTISNEIIRAIEDICEENHVQVFVCNADDEPKKEKGYMEMLIAKQVDGLIIFPTGGNVDYYHLLKKAQFPIVFVDRKIDSSIYPTFMLDNEKAACLAVNQLIGSNRKQIGLISPPTKNGISPRIERIKGYRDVLNNNGLKVTDNWMISTDRNKMVDALEGLWQSGVFPEAFFAVNDLSLIELLRFAKLKKLDVPDHLSVTAIDDSPFLEISTPPITVVRQPTFDIGRDAALKLLELINESELDETYEIIRYTPTLIERESV